MLPNLIKNEFLDRFWVNLVVEWFLRILTGCARMLTNLIKNEFLGRFWEFFLRIVIRCARMLSNPIKNEFLMRFWVNPVVEWFFNDVFT